MWKEGVEERKEGEGKTDLPWKPRLGSRCLGTPILPTLLRPHQVQPLSNQGLL